jgi:Domain of Unknown Function (DUF928)
MNRKRWHIPYLPLLLAIVSVLLLVNTIRVVAQSNSVSQSGTRRPLSAPSSRKRKVIKLKFTLPPKGAPGKRTDAGSRNGCSALNKPLIALVPPTNIGLTVAKRPTFWFYVPYESNSSALGKFQLFDERETVVYTVSISTKGIPGIVGVELPQRFSGLEIGKRYQWVLSFSCNSTSMETSTLVNGFVERVAVTKEFQKRLDGAKILRDSLLVYGEEGLWFDLLSALIVERRRNPYDFQVAEDWFGLLGQVNLSELGDY